MNRKSTLPLVLGAIGLVLVGIASYRLLESGEFTRDVRIPLAAGLILAVGAIFVSNRLKIAAARKEGFPPDDELSRMLKHRAGHTAFHLSTFLWMAIFFFQDQFDKSETMLGLGILGMCGLYGISLRVIKNRGIDDGNSH